jgi:hypothetical protein
MVAEKRMDMDQFKNSSDDSERPVWLFLSMILLVINIVMLAALSIIYLYLILLLAKIDICSAAFGILFLAAVFSFAIMKWVCLNQYPNMMRIYLTTIIIIIGYALFLRLGELNPLPRFIEPDPHKSDISFVWNAKQHSLERLSGKVIESK